MAAKTTEYMALLDLYARAVQTMAGHQFQGHGSWIAEAEHLAVKLFFHLASLLYIRPGTRFDMPAGVKVHFFDFASAAVLARSAFETYLTFYFIFVSPGSPDERHLRYQVWVLGGLLDRQRVTPISAEGKARLHHEAGQIRRLQQEIEQNPAFAALPPKRQKDARKGEWRFGKSWPELAVIAGSSQRYFVGLYAYLSSYAHSGYLSALQIGQAQDKQVQYQLGEPYIDIGLTLMSHFLHSYGALFPPVKELIDADPQARALVDEWDLTGSEMEKLYEGT